MEQVVGEVDSLSPLEPRQHLLLLLTQLLDIQTQIGTHTAATLIHLFSDLGLGLGLGLTYTPDSPGSPAC